MALTENVTVALGGSICFSMILAMFFSNSGFERRRLRCRIRDFFDLWCESR